MTIYIEYVLIDNFIIDYMLLKATFALTGKNCKRKRLFFSAFLGAVFALFYPLITDNNLILIPLKIAVGLLILAVSNVFSSLKSFYIHFLIFFCYTALVGGALISIFNIFNIDYTAEIFSAFIALPVCLLLNGVSRVINYFLRKKPEINFSVNIDLILGQTKISSRGFFDTGNGVYHNLSPVIFCSKNLAILLLEKNKFKVKTFNVYIQTINKKDKKTAFILDELVIYNGDKKNIFNNVTACVISSGTDEIYDVILHPAFMETDNEKNYSKTQKVS